MERTINTVVFHKPKPIPITRVAAYARVSSGKDAMLHSLSAQVSYYSELIQRHPGWLYCGVYADEAMTGTKDHRDNFQRLLDDCRKGELDMVITKSISRFARNTVTLLSTIRELKDLGVDVFFEEQNIHTMSSDGELMITILASYAQEESRSASENQKWRIRKNFEEGKPWNGTMLGYRIESGKLVIVPGEAVIVQRIFREFLSGKGVVAISNGLNADGIVTRFGNRWSNRSISCVLKNYAYTGNLLLQKTVREDYLTKKKLINDGLMTKYHAESTHEPIISIEDYNAVQAEIERRATKYAPPERNYTARYPFSGLIVCANCGKHFLRRVTHAGPVWICSTYKQLGKAGCASKQIPEATLMALTADMGIGTIKEIRAENGNVLIIRFKDGAETSKHWEDRSRSESWTTEKREAARQKALKRGKGNG